MKDTDKTYTLKDLYYWERPEEKDEYAVIGHPIDHSLSPKMFNVAFEKLGQKQPHLKGCRYYKFDIEPKDLNEAIGLFHEKGFAGLNVTAPLKELLSDDKFPTNKLTWTKYNGYKTGNTDIPGFLRISLMRGRNLMDLLQLHIILLGAGGLAKSVAYAVLSAGCKNLTIYNRSEKRAKALAMELQDKHPDVTIHVVTPDENLLGSSYGNFIINATSLGVQPNDPPPIPLSFLDAYRNKIEYVLDLTYGEHKSALLEHAEKRNIPCQNGEELLISQGALAFSLWTGIDVKDVYPIMQDAVACRRSIKERYAEINKFISGEFRRLMKHTGFTKKAIDYCLPSDDELTSFPHDYLTGIINQLRKIAEKSVELIAIPALVNKDLEESCWEKFTTNEEVLREWINTMIFNPEVDIKHNEDNRDMEASLEDMLTSVSDIINYACDDGFIKLRWDVRIKMFTKYLSFRKLFKITHYDYETRSRRAVGVFDVLLP